MLISAQRLERPGERNRVFLVAAAVSLVLHAGALFSVWGRNRLPPDSNPHPVEIELHAKLQAGAGEATAAAALRTGPPQETTFNPAPHPRIARVRTHRKPRPKKVADLSKHKAPAPLTAPMAQVVVPDVEPESAPLPVPKDATPTPQVEVDPKATESAEQMVETGGAIASKEAAFAAAEGTGAGDGAALGRGDNGPGKGGFKDGHGDARGVTEPARASPYNRKPEYPSEARAQGIEGIVRVSLVIDAQGKVAKVEVLSGHPLLIAAVTEMVSTWTFTPAKAYGDPVASRKRFDIPFSLRDER